jgi:CheY-like chemotaxis protein
VRVLIADDSTAIRERLVTLVRELCDCELATASSAAEALALSASYQPDVTVLDLNFKDGSGLAVLRRIKSAPSPPRVIVLTNDPSEHHLRFCMHHGADFFFDKAKDIERLIAAFSGLCRDVERERAQ